jgi:hypothetical protein
VILLGQEDRAVVEQIGIRIVAVNEQYFRDEAPARSTLDVNYEIEGIGDVAADRSNANVRPATTIATSESPRAMVLVKAV